MLQYLEEFTEELLAAQTAAAQSDYTTTGLRLNSIPSFNPSCIARASPSSASQHFSMARLATALGIPYLSRAIIPTVASPEDDCIKRTCTHLDIKSIYTEFKKIKNQNLFE
jgi:hypothetical protein